MNTTYCQSPFARDSMFFAQIGSTDPQCTLAMPLYFIPLIVYAIVLGLVAYVRTLMVQKNKSRNMRGHSHLSPLVPYVIVSASWVSFIVQLLFILIPVTHGTAGNVIVFLLGLECLSFNVLSERWLRKLVRLGSRIISPKSSQIAGSGGKASSSDKGAEDENYRNTLDRLSKADTILKILDCLLIAGIILQVICLCVLSLARPSEDVWLHVGIGIHGFNTFIGLCALIWQYERCNGAITATTRGVKDVARGDLSPGKKGVSLVQAKFRKHQVILAVTGLPATLIYVLWGAGVIPITYILVIITGFYDSVVNGGVLVTFARRVKNRVPSRTGMDMTVTANNNYNTVAAGYTVSEAHGPERSTLGLPNSPSVIVLSETEQL